MTIPDVEINTKDVKHTLVVVKAMAKQGITPRAFFCTSMLDIFSHTCREAEGLIRSQDALKAHIIGLYVSWDDSSCLITMEQVDVEELTITLQATFEDLEVSDKVHSKYITIKGLFDRGLANQAIMGA
ncbi:hypothetical protein L1987_33460 [Smallanthus sonchifolius]|uniref:Uncharacterized protein n=1 Tax=Smallanthus sonchifolius TaxID=185202 RepID=A0ACB9HSI0_9ASTR|nr:hypothetical protein L1987_33460 [Smallanthus sonchifolius]